MYASLTGECAEVDVQLSQEVVSFQTTYVNTHSLRCFRSGVCGLTAHAATRPTVTWHSTMPANILCICCLRTFSGAPCIVTIVHVCRIINQCSTVVQFSWRQFATADEEFGSAAAGISEILKHTSMGPEDPMLNVLDSLSSGTSANHAVICSPWLASCMPV